MSNYYSNIDISVIILTKNGEGTIDRCLRAVFNQSRARDLEVICVDSGSRDMTLDICKVYGVRLFQIEPKEFNHGLTRNFAVGKAQGEYLVFLSQDAVLGDTNTIGTLVGNLEMDRKAAGVYCRHIAHPYDSILIQEKIDRHFTGRKQRRESQIFTRGTFSRLNPFEKYEFCNFDNVCSCIRKGIWKDIKFSDVPFAEDLDWSKRVIEAGYKIIYEPRVRVIHSHNYGIFYEFKRAYLHHMMLFRTFSLRTISSLGKILPHSLKCSYLHLKSILEKQSNIFVIFRLMVKDLFVNFASCLGQYMGGRHQMMNFKE